MCSSDLWDGGAWRAPDLLIPHERLHERRFALEPLVEIDPGLVLPDGERIADLLAAPAVQAQHATRLGPLA